jgi:flagellar basal-body rod protein FlgG
MSGAIYMAASGALNQQMYLEVLANNLSNINTVGFKEDRAAFQVANTSNAASEEMAVPRPGSSPFQVPRVLSGTVTSFSSGPLKNTANPLDMALTGNGFFSIETADGIHYTRKGNFDLNTEGVLVTKEGQTVLGEGGQIQINGQEFTVDTKGNVLVDGDLVDRLKIVDFQDPSTLLKVGNTLFAPENKNVAVNQAEDVEVNQGFIELSNVETIRLMTEMIEALRGYESYQKIIRSIDDVTSKAINDVGSLA